jgi:DMSO/TMAO reductase YedYZ molybdopterin-dependent catalytic subunit
MSAPLLNANTSRRGLIGAGAAGLGGLLLSGCDRLAMAPQAINIVRSAQYLTYDAQRLILAGQPLAREFKPSDLSPVFKANGSLHPAGDAYQALLDSNFATWTLTLDGLVANPLKLSLAQIKSLPSRTQITRHDCVEGWSAIGGWTGVQLSRLLTAAKLLPNARFVIFHCADNLGGSSDDSGLYYESIDLLDAFHPQTILAYALNGSPLTVPHGAPLRLRAERLLGYKQAKYIMRIEIAERMDHLGGGKGGFWEDRGYDWYGGI